jgi:hypothetical protein
VGYTAKAFFASVGAAVFASVVSIVLGWFNRCAASASTDFQVEVARLQERLSASVSREALLSTSLASANDTIGRLNSSSILEDTLKAGLVPANSHRSAVAALNRQDTGISFAGASNSTMLGQSVAPNSTTAGDATRELLLLNGTSV